MPGSSAFSSPESNPASPESNCRATASGYQSARASFAVLVDETGLGVVTSEATFACQDFEDLEESVRLLLEEGIFASTEFLTRKVLAETCGVFEEGDQIEWKGEEESLFGASAIRVWGSPLTGRQLEPAPRTPWWTFREATSFWEDPETTTAAGKATFASAAAEVRAMVVNSSSH